MLQMKRKVTSLSFRFLTCIMEMILLTCQPLISLPRGSSRIMGGRVTEKLEIKGNLLLYYHKIGHICTIYLSIL